MTNTHVELQLKTLPDQPGVYQFFDNTGVIIYVGKAKNLKKRVSSYFNKEHESAKTKMLVRKISTIKHIVVESETDALLLENNLIKEYQPKYNIMLKDDKSYPWICIKNEPFPRVFFTRRFVKDGSMYFGPYTNLKIVSTLLDLIREIYPIRSCSLDLREKYIDSGKYKVCLEYHIKNCMGICEGLEKKEQYDGYIAQIKDILKGNLREVIAHFKDEMQKYASLLKFEEANEIKKKLEMLENYQAKSTIVSTKITNVDVFSIVSDQDFGYVNFLQVSFGAIVRAHNLKIKKKLEESDRELLEWAIISIREKFDSNSKEIIVPFEVTVSEEVSASIPKQGEKHQLLELSKKNAFQYRQEKFKQNRLTDPERHTNRMLSKLQGYLGLDAPPVHIECFDNSNIQGSNPVAACVVFKKGKPSKKDYRKFNIKTVEGADDYSSMKEVVLRRYSRLIEQGEKLPDLIIVDGGQGQINAVRDVIENQLKISIPIAGLSKNEKHQTSELLIGNPVQEVHIPQKTEEFLFLRRIQDEVHRFAITFHRQKRSKNAIVSELDSIKGVGEKTKEKLLIHFKSVKRIKEASLKDIESVVGVSMAKKIRDAFD